MPRTLYSRARRLSGTRLLIGLGVVLAASGCETTPLAEAPPDKPAPQVVRTDRLESRYDERGRLTTLQYDRNGDGRVDTWGYMNGAQVVRVEVDENGDGSVDRWEHHRTAPDSPAPSPQAALAGPDSTVERIERAMRYDGQVTRRELFSHGMLVRVEEDTDGNGTPDKWETYANGTLTLVALDTTGRGTPDRRLVYAANGTFDHIEEDPTGTGRFRTLTP